MEKKTTKKKKTASKPSRTKATVKKKKRSTTAQAYAPRIRETPHHAARSLPRSTSAPRWTTYYGIGGLALAILLTLLGYQEIRGRWSGEGKSPTDEIGIRHQAVESNTQHGNPAAETVSSESNVKASEETEAEAEKPTSMTRKISSEGNGVLAEEFKTVQPMNFAERINFWSNYLEKNLPGRAKVKALAEGHKINDNVPIVPDEYDCTTYVETVAALARSQTPDDFFNHLISIRYREGKPGYVNRNHFPEADWIPNNQKAAILSDVTSQVAQAGGLKAKTEKKKIDRAKWLQVQLKQGTVNRAIASVTEKAWKTPVTAKVNYIEIAEIKKVMNEIPNGTVLNLVHKDDGVHPTLITHQGFVFKSGNRVFLRHASRGGRIRESELYSYLKGLLRTQNPNTRWPLIGVNLNQIKDSTSESNLRTAEM